MSGFPLTGFVPCFLSHGMMCVSSKTVPSDVQTGCSKGWRDSAQKRKGSRRKGRVVFERKPWEAPKLSAEAHSLWVMYSLSVPTQCQPLYSRMLNLSGRTYLFPWLVIFGGEVELSGKQGDAHSTVAASDQLTNRFV